MLHFILGTAGTGKTTQLMDAMAAAVEAGQKAILLVPEQLSFESEKRIYRTLGPRRSLDVEVLSFTRVCNSVFRAFGGLADTPVTPSARYLLMSIAVEELRGTLGIYKKSCEDTAFLQTLIETCSEFKTAGVKPEDLAGAAAGYQDELGEKLTDLAAIYGAYQGLLSRGYTDSDDDLIRACALLELNNYFEDFVVFVDGFTTFMAAEFELLGHMIAQAPHIHFAMTCDGPQDRQQGMGVFSTVKGAVGRLTRMAKAAGVPVDTVTQLTAAKRFAQKSLEHLSLHFFQPDAPEYRGDPGDSLSLRVAYDRYHEVEMVAADISRLVREKGLRYREIAVVTRETSHYIRAVEAVFGRYGIPCFMDLPNQVDSHPLVAGLLHGVEAIRGSYDTQAILLLAKSPLMNLDPVAVAQLENYCYCWDVRGAVWTGELANNPRGLAGALTDEDKARLAAINETRAALMDPLQNLKEALARENGRDFAQGLFAFLEQVQAPDNLTGYSEGLPQEQRAAFLNESAQVWDSLVSILDIFGTVLGSRRLPKRRLCELLRMALDTAEVGLPPQTLDQVLVGKADRIRPVDLKAVFVIGAVEGEFPAQVTPAGVFSDEERRRLIDGGIDISAPTLHQTVLEKYFAYYAVTLASGWLAVSWPKADLAGQELLPSAIVGQIEEIFPALHPAPMAPEQLAVGDKASFQLLAEAWGEQSGFEASLRQYFLEQGGEDALDTLAAARRPTSFTLEDAALAKGLFGKSMRLSPTKVERYYRCPFSYFVADGLRVRTRQRVEFSPLESGSVIHHVLQVMVQRHGGAGLYTLKQEELEKEIGGIIQEYLVQRVERMDSLPARFQYLFGRLTGMLARLVIRLGKEFHQSEFVPVATELPISAQEGVEPLHLLTADGIPVAVEGVVDRVDVMEKNGRRYVRVVDYKSGGKTFALQDVLYGLNMQMLLYLFTIGENGKGELADLIPAGVLYMPVREKYISATRDTPDGKIGAQREKQWQMNGLLLEDDDVLRGMEQELSGVFIPAKLGKDGTLDAKSSLAGKAEMGRLATKVKELVVGMVEALAEGEIPACPVVDTDYKTCEYCPYQVVCGVGPASPVREIAKLDRAAVFKLLEEEQEHGGA